MGDCRRSSWLSKQMHESQGRDVIHNRTWICHPVLAAVASVYASEQTAFDALFVKSQVALGENCTEVVIQI